MSAIKDKKIGVFEIVPERDLKGDEVKVKRYIHGRNRLYAYVIGGKQNGEMKAAVSSYNKVNDELYEYLLEQNSRK